jgi:hypothetical protein
MTITLLAGLGIAIILGLASYALYLLTALNRQKKERVEQLKALEEKQEKQHAYIIESLQVISANVIEEDLNLSEATIRCKMLLDGLILTPDERQPYSVLDEVFEQIQHFDTHQARKNLTKDERKKQDKAREAIEEQYRASLTECFTRLREFAG